MLIEFALARWEFKHTKTHYLHKLFSLIRNGLLFSCDCNMYVPYRTKMKFAYVLLLCLI